MHNGECGGGGAEVGEEWSSGRWVQEGTNQLSVESLIEVMYISDATCVTLKDIPLGVR